LERAKVAGAATTIRQLRAMKDRVPIACLLGEALDRTGYDAVLLSEFLGERKLANLHKLVEQARAADHSGASDLDAFITQLNQFTTRDPKEALAATLPEAADVIRLMTIHHAKGLEFPLVIVPDLDRAPRLDAPFAALDAKLGPLVPQPSDTEGDRSPVGMTMFAAMERIEELEERKRMLYVALTRARDHLILSSSLESFDKPCSDWMKLIAGRFDLASGEVVATPPPRAEKARIQVTTDPKSNYTPEGKTRGEDLVAVIDAARAEAASRRHTTPSEVCPIPVDNAARRQFSFSRLTGQLVRRDVPWTPGVSPVAVDSRSDGALIDPRGFGSLVHDVLARLSLKGGQEIREWCEHLAPLHVTHDVGRAAKEARLLIEKFVATSRGQELVNAKSLHREVEFLLAWPREREADEAGALVHLYGFIDSLYQAQDGAWRLADYKTNQVTSEEVARTASKYAMQMYVYAMAAERVLGESPRELVLHFLRPGVEYVFAWDDASRRRGTDMVNDAITDALKKVVE
jgi:ATP-dependent helicase/nuclease subunit A